jgi:L-ascorbate metabolism protein UlaG (beta-lactamase superfamily)
MKIKWYGHSAFRFISDDGTRIITDPYEPNCYNGALGYATITDPADIVLSSHDHADHNWAKGITGNPIIVKDSGNHTPKGIHIKGISTYHDKCRGKERGPNNIFVIELDKMRVCHLGDLGHDLTPSDASIIGPIDILFPPIGGFFTIDAAEALHIVDRLQPKLVIPMHYKTEKCNFKIGTLEPFLTSRKFNKIEQTEIEVSLHTLPQQTEIWVIPHSN